MLAIFTLSTGQKKVAVNPRAVARVMEGNSTSTNISQISDPGNPVSVMGSFDEVIKKLKEAWVS